MEISPSILIIAACWLASEQPAAGADSASSGQYQLVTDGGGQAVCAVTAPSVQVVARSSVACMSECMQLLSACVGANFVKPSVCQMFDYFPNAFAAQTGCRHYQHKMRHRQAEAPPVAHFMLQTNKNSAQKNNVSVVPAETCDIPFTYNATLYHRCAPTYIMALNATCDQWSCLLTKRRPAVCETPADFVAMYVMESIAVPTWNGSIPALSVNAWIIIQQRLDGSLNFNQGWAAYKSGFGNQSSSYWLGNEAVHQLTTQPFLTYRLRFELLVTSGQWISAEYDTFQVQDGTTNFYRIWVSGYSGDGGDSMNVKTHPGYPQNGMMFTTNDAQHDNSAGSCAVTYGGGFWYNDCFACNLNGAYTSHFHWAVSRSLSQSRMMMKAI